jgi:hypothetical protein
VLHQWKAKVLGLNAVRVYGIVVPDIKQVAEMDEAEDWKRKYREAPGPGFAGRGPMTPAQFGAMRAGQCRL